LNEIDSDEIQTAVDNASFGTVTTATSNTGEQRLPVLGEVDV
jgi:hypothetical protein